MDGLTASDGRDAVGVDFGRHSVTEHQQVPLSTAISRRELRYLGQYLKLQLLFPAYYSLDLSLKHVSSQPA